MSLGYPGLFALSLINGVAFFPGPSQVATFLAGGSYQPLAVGVVAGVGGAVGELAGYFAGKSGRPVLSPRNQERITSSRIASVSLSRSFLPLFLLAIVPNPLFDIVSVFAGAIQLPFLRYFVPVLIGKVFRHVAIAYAGQVVVGQGYKMPIGAFGPASYVVVNYFLVLSLGFLAWLYRTLAAEDPDPFLLNMTLFATFGQLILLVQSMFSKQGPLGVLVLLGFGSFILIVVQVFAFHRQVDLTREHYTALLTTYKTADTMDHTVEHWAEVAVKVTGVDFYPEWYENLSKLFKNHRAERRKMAHSILPSANFKVQEFSPADFTVPEDQRKGPWRFYAILCGLSWAVYLVSSLIAR